MLKSGTKVCIIIKIMPYVQLYKFNWKKDFDDDMRCTYNLFIKKNSGERLRREIGVLRI